MQLIKKEDKNLSFRLKITLVISTIIFLTAFFLSLKFSGKKKNEFPTLQFSPLLKTPKANIAAGFYEDSFKVQLSSENGSTLIYYTTDGSEPSLASKKYSGPVTIENTGNKKRELARIPTSPRWKPPVGEVYNGVVLRAISVDENNNKSRELTKTFFINKAGNRRYSFPVVAITVNEKDFFGYNHGIYVLGKNYGDKNNYARKDIPLDLKWFDYPSNYLIRGDNAERPAHIEFFEPGGQLGFELNSGVRINGNGTRGFAQKALRICLHEKYGMTQLNYDLFSTGKKEAINSFILRNSGNDWDKTMFRDAFMQSLMKDTYVDIQNYRPAIVFLNGEYWGIHNIRERFDQYYLANKYHFAVDSVTILEQSGKFVVGDKKNGDAFSDLVKFAKEKDLSVKENYDYVQSKIDMASFTDFLIANIYFCNSDWPSNNVKFWRFDGTPRAGSLDGKWHWMLYDTDWGFNYNDLSKPESNLLSRATTVGSVGILFNSLLRSKEFTRAFLIRYQYHLDHTFDAPQVVLKINAFKTKLQPEIKEHINRWRVIGSYTNWLKNIDLMIDFAVKRPQIQADQLNAFFHLSESEQIRIKK